MAFGIASDSLANKLFTNVNGESAGEEFILNSIVFGARLVVHNFWPSADVMGQSDTREIAKMIFIGSEVQSIPPNPRLKAMTPGPDLGLIPPKS